MHIHAALYDERLEKVQCSTHRCIERAIASFVEWPFAVLHARTI